MLKGSPVKGSSLKSSDTRSEDVMAAPKASDRWTMQRGYKGGAAKHAFESGRYTQKTVKEDARPGRRASSPARSSS